MMMYTIKDTDTNLQYGFKAGSYSEAVKLVIEYIAGLEMLPLSHYNNREMKVKKFEEETFITKKVEILEDGIVINDIQS